ncbi:MAG: rhodanese-like domain-containing protein [Actinomycetota bacterium]|nr:rhodanese-like domain-containing protein [Actinomycetota bacterium]
MSQQPPAVPGMQLDAVDEDAYLLDVREPDEWAAGHAPQAQHVPLADVPARVDQLPRDRQVVVTCRSGGRSARATAYLRSVGVDAVNLEGGMKGWAGTGRPLQSETGGQAEII